MDPKPPPPPAARPAASKPPPPPPPLRANPSQSPPLPAAARSVAPPPPGTSSQQAASFAHAALPTTPQQLRVSVKVSVRDPNLLVVRPLPEGQPLPPGTREALLVMAE